jgi:hypothetical protein
MARGISVQWKASHMVSRSTCWLATVLFPTDQYIVLDMFQERRGVPSKSPSPSFSQLLPPKTSNI